MCIFTIITFTDFYNFGIKMDIIVLMKKINNTMKNRLEHPASILMLGILCVIGVSCQKIDTSGLSESNGIFNMKVNPLFKFSTTKAVGINIYTLDNTGAPVSNMKVDIYTDLPEKEGALILSGITDANGLFSSDYKIPSGIDSIAVGTNAIGFCNMQKVAVDGNSVNLTLGGIPKKQAKGSAKSSFYTANTGLYPMGTFNSAGVPDYLEPSNDIIAASMIQDLNAMLPQYQNATVRLPQYFTNSAEQNIVLNGACDVWVTFVSEGAGYNNTMGYYRYNKNNPPATAADIDSIHVVFPNASFAGSGGGLASGNKVHLGRFAPGTGIGWVLISDGFRNKTITDGNWKLFSDRKLNPESDPTIRQHVIMLNDIGRGNFLLSFEDIKRDMGTDNDFNDVIFFVTTNPVQAVAIQNIPLPNYTQADIDKDGIPDAFDNYPNDPLKAFDNYYPSKDNFGSLAFEDMWPSQGDYDFNDIVVDYNFDQVTNGQNKVVQIKVRALVTAMGGYYQNGFGIQLPVSPKLISGVTGTSIHGSYIVQNSNGTESGQSKATIIIFDNGFNLLPYPGGGKVGVNTTKGAPYVTPKELNITISLTAPVSLNEIGLPPYNPFMIKDSKRAYEVHLIDNLPTDLAGIKILGTSDDNSNPSTGKYYSTKNNLPFAIDISSHFDYPVEKTEVTMAFFKFVPWGESSGSQYWDWFKTNPGYRAKENIYSH